MAEPLMTIVTRADITSITDATTGRKALVLDGSTIELGKTGMRDVSGLFVADHVTSGRVLVERVGNLVTWTLVGLNLKGPVTSVWSVLANTAGRFDGFKPVYTQAATIMQSDAELARLMINGSGSVDIHYGAAGVNYPGQITYTTTQPWPTVLPGVADGQPVGV